MYYFISFLLISAFISVFVGLTIEDPRGSKTQTTDNQSNVITPVHVSYGTPIFTDNFDAANDTTSLKARGYKPYYRGTGAQGTIATWYQGQIAVFNAFNGPDTGYVAANYSVVTGANNIDSWLVLPRVTGGLLATDSLFFYERSATGSTYPDSVRVMYSANDSVPEGSWTELGRFKTNTTTGWQRHGFKAAAASANGRFAIRYCVVNGGPSGANSDYMGIDALTIERTAAPTVPQYYNFNTTIGSNAFPFSVVAGKLTQFLVLPGELNQPTPAPSGTITKFYIFCATASITYTNLTIKFGQSTITTLPTGVFYTDPMDTVYFNPSVTLNSTMGTFTPITLSRPYVYDNTKSLIIEISQCGASATGMSTYHTSFTGSNRRTYNQTAGGCNYIYQGQGSPLMHCGIDVTAGPVAALPDLIYYKFKNNPSPSLTPNFAIPGVGTNPAPLTTLTLTTPGQFDSCLSGTATASAKIVTGYSLSTGTSSFTISMWLNNLVTPASTRYLFGDAGLSFRCFVGGVAPANGAIFRGTGINDVLIRNIFPGPTVIHIVYDSALSNVKVYKNGILDTTVAQTAFNFTT
ncbi:MAG: choice-of-anchor J domain-containing protein, partial [Ignavibacteriae bacterium]|nr:choice-of-anchor J domain-containing protein [Ignavibacteriota bacterium]